MTGPGTAGTVSLWAGALTQGNSDIVQVGLDIGINEATPATTLDVGGAATGRGKLSLPAEAPATTTSGYRSQLLQLGASVRSTTAAAPVSQNFSLATEVLGNNTATPSGFLQLRLQMTLLPKQFGKPFPTSEDLSRRELLKCRI